MDGHYLAGKMYRAFYGLKEKPFNLHPDPDYLYMSKGHENAYTHLEYAVTESKGFVVVTGEIGSGKTTLINYLLSQIPEHVNIGLVNNTYISPSQFFKLMCREFELEIDGMDKSAMIETFHDFLLEQYAHKRRVLLIVDEGQNLAPKTLEEIRLLSNLESEKDHLIQIILVGQPELKFKLKRKDLAQFSQRVTVHCHLNGMNPTEVMQYIQYRLSIAGAEKSRIFSEEAVKMIAEYSRGIPRLINILCDTALVYGFADGCKTIEKKIVEDVINERAAGGIFKDFQQDADPNEGPGAHQEWGGGVQGEFPSAPDQNRLYELEKRLEFIEKKLGEFERRFNGLTHTSDEKNTLMLDLFKLLKESMESRFDILMKVTNARKN